MNRGTCVRCFLASFLGALALLSSQQVFAANFSDISLKTDPYWGDNSYGPTDYLVDWRRYCSPRKTNFVRWYTGDGTLRSIVSDFDCADGMSTFASGPVGIPGAISLWGYAASVLPASVPHNIANSNFGPDGDFYFTLTTASSTYSSNFANNPIGVTIHPSPVWADGLYSSLDYTGDWTPYCSPGASNIVEWYRRDGTREYRVTSFDCAVGMALTGDRMNNIPGTIPLWLAPSRAPGTLPHNVGNLNFGGDGDFYFILWNSLGGSYRFDYGWHTVSEVHRFDWSWHAGFGYSFPNQATSTPPCTEKCYDNVLFLPGFEASRLYRPDSNGGANRLWEPNSDADASDIGLDQNGISIRNDIFTKDVMDEAYVSEAGPNIYKSFLTSMDDLKLSGKINDWAPIPYDWRLSLDDVLNYGNNVDGKLYYSGDLRATSTPYVIQELKRLAASSKSGKVTIIAHSNGGLVAKALMLKLGLDAAKYVDRVILIAVPQVGTPAAIPALLHGYGQNIPFLLSEKAVRAFGINSPGAYNLLPSFSYYSSVSDPVISIDASTLPNWVSKYGNSISLEGEFRNFAVDSFERVPANNFNIKIPTQLNANVLSQSEAMHAMLDSWTPPVGVQLIQIAGWGVPTTIKGIEYASSTKPVFCTGICPGGLTVNPKTTIDGDGTVVVPSALWTSASAGAVNYWLDLKKYNKDHPFQAALPPTRFTHTRILEVEPLLSFLENVLTGTQISVDQYVSTQAPSASESRLSYALHSPLTFDLYDNQGRHTGVSTTTGKVVEEIPGTYYMQFGEVKYIFSDASTPNHIVMSGYANGTFTFIVNQLQGDSLIATSTFKNIPTTSQTKVTIDTVSDITTLSPMRLDLNGDGIADYSLTSKLNDTAVLDTTPPEIQIKFSTSTNTLVFSGMDDSGQVSIIAATSYPAFKKNQKTIQGTATTTITGRDSAGNTTSLIYTEKLPHPDRRIPISPTSISYNGIVANLGTTTLKYKWALNNDNGYKMFSSFIQTPATSTESHWRPKKNVTILMTNPLDVDDSDGDDDADARLTTLKLAGFVIPNLKTQQGKVMIGY